MSYRDNEGHIDRMLMDADDRADYEQWSAEVDEINGDILPEDDEYDYDDSDCGDYLPSSMYDEDNPENY